MANVLLGIHCVVPGCKNTLKKVNQWKVRLCSKPKHKGKLHSQCMCPEPYQFFKFPSEVKLQKLWQERVKRPDLEINNLTRVCSVHFVDGRPTRRHYFPDLSLKAKDDDEIGELDDEENEGGGGGEDESNEVKHIPGRAGGSVSIVPMELLQGEEDEMVEEIYDEDDRGNVGGDLTISSRFDHDDDVGEYEKVPAVTITRVSSPSKATSSRRSSTTSASLGNSSDIGQRASVPRTNDLQDDEDDGDSDCPFKVEVVGDDDMDDGESSDLSDDLGMIQTTRRNDAPKLPASKKLIIVSRSSGQQNPRTFSSVASSSMPKVVPVLAVAPKSQSQGIIGTTTTTIQPVNARFTSNHPGLLKKPNPTPAISSRSSGLANGNSVQKTTSSTIVATSPGALNGSAIQKPVATYDPSKQQLQIANPVKYIQDCHIRIAELLAEKEKAEARSKQLEQRTKQLEQKVEELQKSNTDLRHQVMNQTLVRTKQLTPTPHLSTPTFNLIPSMSQSLGTSLHNGNGSISIASIGNESTGTTRKPVVRYIIRRKT